MKVAAAVLLFQRGLSLTSSCFWERNYMLPSSKVCIEAHLPKRRLTLEPCNVETLESSLHPLKFSKGSSCFHHLSDLCPRNVGHRCQYIKNVRATTQVGGRSTSPWSNWTEGQPPPRMCSRQPSITHRTSFTGWLSIWHRKAMLRKEKTLMWVVERLINLFTHINTQMCVPDPNFKWFNYFEKLKKITGPDDSSL